MECRSTSVMSGKEAIPGENDSELVVCIKMYANICIASQHRPIFAGVFVAFSCEISEKIFRIASHLPGHFSAILETPPPLSFPGLPAVSPFLDYFWFWASFPFCWKPLHFCANLRFFVRFCAFFFSYQNGLQKSGSLRRILQKCTKKIYAKPPLVILVACTENL